MSLSVVAVQPLSSTGSHRSPARRLLLLSYHFPPSQAAGALRWQKFTALAAERGWAVDVVTLDARLVDRPDARRTGELPSSTRTFSVAAGEPRLVRFERALRGLVSRVRAAERAGRVDGHAPDVHSPAVAASTAGSGAAVTPAAAPAEAYTRAALRWRPRGWRDLTRAYIAWAFHARERTWARAAEARARALLAAEPGTHDLIVSCGPPHMVHEAGATLAQEFGLPFVMDLRDPWGTCPYLGEEYASPLWYAIADRAERRAVRTAMLVVMNTDAARDAMAAQHPGARERIVTVMNGYDEEPLPVARARDTFLVAYAGSIYINRDPRLVFRAAGRMVASLGLTPRDLAFRFVGLAASYKGLSLEEMARQEGLEGFVTTGPTLPRPAVLELMASACLLLNLPQDVEVSVPSKIYEYMRFAAWVLALENPGSATARVLAQTTADVVPPHDVDAIEGVLRRRYAEFRAGVRPAPVARDDRFSRRTQGGVLFDAIEVRLQARART